MSDLEGIGPEDVRNILPADDVDDDKEELVELHDSERMEAMRILAHIQSKYSDRKASYENLVSMAREAEDMFEKIGLQVIVDWVGPGLTGAPPTITVVRRLTPFDPERMQYDVRKGVADSYWEGVRERDKKRR